MNQAIQDIQVGDDKIVETTVHLSIVEVTLGSLFHSLHIPFTGHLLSLNQGLFLESSVPEKYSRKEAFEHVFISSACISVMKSFAPAGKKLGPMISITTQGFLLGMGFWVGGNNLLGRSLGMGLLSFWAFLQPLVTFFLLFGTDLVRAGEYYQKKIHKHFGLSGEDLLWGLSLIVLFKFFVACSLPFVSKKIRPLIEKNVTEKTFSTSKRKKKWKNSLLLVISFCLMFSFYYSHGKSYTELFWVMMRPVSVLIILSYLSRSSWTARCIDLLATKFQFVQRLVSLGEKVKKKIF